MAVLYFFKEPKTIYECCALLCSLQFICSCNSIWKLGERFVVNGWTRLFSLIGASFAIFALSASLYLLISDPAESERLQSQDKLLLSIAALELLLSVFAYVVVSCSMQLGACQQRRLYDRIHALDQRLMREFGANLNYYKLKRKTIIEAMFLITAYLSAVYATMLQLTHGSLVVRCVAAWFYLAISSGPHVCCYVHINFTVILRIRFRLLQQLLRPNYLNAKFPHARLRERRLHTAIETVKELHDIINDINAIYKLTLLAALTHDFTLTTSELYMLFGHSMTGSISYKLMIFIVVCMLQPLYKLLTAPIMCDLALKEGKKCWRLIEQVDYWYPKSLPVQRMVTSAMFWRLENKIEFICTLNIVYNAAIIATITATVFNYLLIIIQFRMTQQMGAQIEEQKNILQDWIGDL